MQVDRDPSPPQIGWERFIPPFPLGWERFILESSPGPTQQLQQVNVKGRGSDEGGDHNHWRASDEGTDRGDE